MHWSTDPVVVFVYLKAAKYFRVSFNAYILCIYSNASEFEVTEQFQTTGEPYNGDALTPVFFCSKEAINGDFVTAILLDEHNPHLVCVSQPLNVAHNACF